MEVFEKSRQEGVVISLRKHFVSLLIIIVTFLKLRWTITKSLQVFNVNDPFALDQQNQLCSLWITAVKSNMVDFC